MKQLCDATLSFGVGKFWDMGKTFAFRLLETWENCFWRWSLTTGLPSWLCSLERLPLNILHLWVHSLSCGHWHRQLLLVLLLFHVLSLPSLPIFCILLPLSFLLYSLLLFLLILFSVTSVNGNTGINLMNTKSSQPYYCLCMFSDRDLKIFFTLLAYEIGMVVSVSDFLDWSLQTNELTDCHFLCITLLWYPFTHLVMAIL